MILTHRDCKHATRSGNASESCQAESPRPLALLSREDMLKGEGFGQRANRLRAWARRAKGGLGAGLILQPQQVSGSLVLCSGWVGSRAPSGKGAWGTLTLTLHPLTPVLLIS